MVSNATYGESADVGDGLDALVQQINGQYQDIMSDAVLAKWKLEHSDVDMLKRCVVQSVSFLRESGLTMGGMERLKDHIAFNTLSDDSPAPSAPSAPAALSALSVPPAPPAPLRWDEEKVEYDKICIDYKRKFYDYLLGQVCDNDEPDTKEMCKKMNSLVQQNKYK